MSKVENTGNAIAEALAPVQEKLFQDMSTQLAVANEHGKEMTEKTDERLAQISKHAKAVHFAYDVATRLAKEGRMEDARDIRDIAVSFSQAVVELLDAQRTIIDTKHAVVEVGANTSKSALEAQAVVIKTVKEVLAKEEEKVSTRNGGRTSPRESKYLLYRVAVIEALQENPHLTGPEALDICKNYQEKHNYEAFPNLNTIYTWLPGRSKKKRKG
jgi:hypothetical protein